MPMTEKEEKAAEKKLAAAIKAERKLVDDVLKSHIATARTIESKDLKKHLVASLTQLRGDIGEVRSAHDAAP